MLRESKAMTDQPSLFGTAEPEAEPVVPGLRLVPDFVSADEAKDLLAAIDATEWLSDLSRRVQHHGWRYDYKARTVTRDMRLGPLPAWAADLARRIHDAGHFDQIPDQVIVNEYQPGQGIASHIDCEPCFGPIVATLSLGDTWVMDFEPPAGDTVSLDLPVRSLAVLSGPARCDWRHGIAKRKSDPGRAVRRVRRRRVSVTFRTVIVGR
jgi:alkylated DNA repair dioxygenase AlkB